jgi:hypothetical protein
MLGGMIGGVDMVVGPFLIISSSSLSLFSSPFSFLLFLDPLLSSLCGVHDELCTYLFWV